MMSAEDILLLDEDYLSKVRRLLLVDDLLALGGVRFGDICD